jgi:hypothetical protein
LKLHWLRAVVEKQLWQLLPVATWLTQPGRVQLSREELGNWLQAGDKCIDGELADDVVDGENRQVSPSHHLSIGPNGFHSLVFWQYGVAERTSLEWSIG